MNNFFNIITKPLQWAWAGLKFMYNTKLMVGLPVVTLFSGVIATAIAPASIAALEIMTFGLYASVVGSIGYSVASIYYGHLLRKEKRLIAKIIKEAPTKELAKGLSKEKAFKICIDLARNHLELATVQKHAGKINKSVLNNLQGQEFTSKAGNSPASKQAKARVNVKYYEALKLCRETLIIAGQFTGLDATIIDKKYRKAKSETRITEEVYAPYHSARVIYLPNGTSITNDNTSIYCHTNSALQRFEELFERDIFSVKKENYISIEYGNMITPSEIHIQNKKLINECKDILIDEARELAERGEKIFPFVVRITNGRGKTLEQTISTIGELDEYDKRIEEESDKNEMVNN